jgi:Family of unknown function (DUF6064)
MAEWWTYSLSDFLLFSPRTYYRLFELYNAAVWPGQVLALAVGLAIAAMLWKPRRWQGRVVAILLAACWLWIAWAYFLTRYATINWAAPYVAAAFAGEALLLVLIGAAGRFSLPPDVRRAGCVGVGLYVFALVIQPLIGPLAGRAWSQVEVFGIAPDPTVVATLGVLLRATARPRWALLPIPVAWCAVSGATAWAMGSSDAWVVPIAGVLTLVSALLPRSTLPPRRAVARSGAPASEPADQPGRPSAGQRRPEA